MDDESLDDETSDEDYSGPRRERRDDGDPTVPSVQVDGLGLQSPLRCHFDAVRRADSKSLAKRVCDYLQEVGNDAAEYHCCLCGHTIRGYFGFERPDGSWEEKHVLDILAEPTSSRTLCLWCYVNPGVRHPSWDHAQVARYIDAYQQVFKAC